jgi:hypothetical protein
MSNIMIWPADQPNHRQKREAGFCLTAQHLERLPERDLDAGDGLGAVRGLAQCRGRRREQTLHVLGAGELTCLCRGILEGADALLGDRPVGREEPHESQHGTPARGRERPPARVHVGDQQMDGVRPDVENP